MKRNIESEIKLSSRQAVSALKQKIIDVLLVKSVDEKISADLSEPGFIKELLTTIVTNWKTGEGVEMSLEAVLPDKLKGKLDTTLQNSLKKNMNEGVEISFSKNIKGGFQIGSKGGTFKVSLTDEDFSEFFKEYLRPKTRSFLFEE
jgi:V/A-type H+-transporting ATPase subunit E